jgi:hypothetical protein
MELISGRNFGLLIAYVVPGYIGLYAISYWNNEIRTLISLNHVEVAELVYIVFLSLVVGLLLSPLRWIIVDKF